MTARLRSSLASAQRETGSMWTILVALIAWMTLPGFGGALAQSFPYKPVKLIAGHAPGGQGDTIGRIIAPKLAELWGQPVVVENRPGAAGTIAATFVARAPPNGHMLLISSGTLALSAVIGKDLPFDTTRDLTLIGRLASVPIVLALGSRIPASNIAELVAHAKGRPGQLSAGSSGHGSTSGFALEMLNGSAGIDILQVPYGGAGPAVIGVLSGQTDMVFADFGVVSPHVKSGALRLIAALGSRRLSVAPDLPTIREQGLVDVAVDSHVGIVGPAGMPAETLAKLSSSLNQVLRMPDVRQRLLELGFEPVEDTPALYAAALREDIERFSIAARRIGLHMPK